MYLRRKIDAYLENWKSDPNHKPLIIRGARQIGKTESILHFAKQHYDSIIEINFVSEPKYKMIVADGYDASDIIKTSPVLIHLKSSFPEKHLYSLMK